MEPNQFLSDRTETRIRTAFIAAIQIIEDYGEALSEEDFALIRKQILDRGNEQIRLMKTELKFFDVRMTGPMMSVKQYKRD